MAKSKSHIKRKKNKPTTKSVHREKKSYWIPGVILFALAFLLNLNTLSHEYALDDASAVEKNWVVQKGISGIPTLLTTNYRYGFWNAPGTLYRPLSQIVLAIAWQIAPDNPGFYHFINVLLYALSGFLLFYLLSSWWTQKKGIVFIITALFIAHPVHTEVVANIKSMDEVLAFLFLIITLILFGAYLNKKKAGLLIAALIAYLASLLAKESAITYLALFPLVAYYFYRLSPVAAIKRSLIFATPALIFVAIRSTILGSMKGINTISQIDNFLVLADNPLEKFVGAIHMIGHYLQVSVFPWRLVSDQGFNQIPLPTLLDLRFWITLLILIAAIYLVLKSWKQRSSITFGLLWFGITFSIYANLVILIGSSYGERFLFVPVLGIILSGVFGLFSAFNKREPNYQSLVEMFKKGGIPVILAVVLFVFFSFQTVSRNPVWKNSFTLYENDIKSSPNSAKLRYHLGLEYLKKRDKAQNPNERNEFIIRSTKEFNEALKIFPEYADPYTQLGLAHYYLKNPEQALGYYQKAIELKSNNALAYNNMGIIYFEQGNLPKAQEVYTKAIEINPRYAGALQNLGSVFAMQKQFGTAIDYFQQALQYDPKNAQLHYFLGLAFRDSGDNTSSQRYLNLAYQLDPALRK